jgi:hypothetical protein
MNEIKYEEDEKGNLVVGIAAPFDGKPVLIKLAEGWVEAYWEPGREYDTPDGRESEGFCWVCLDDKFDADIDDAKAWAALPESEQANEIKIEG